jgi:uncharacterized membrane protein HdeD (DUF308 family)
MNTTSMGLPGLVKKSITWSIILSTLMILAGFLAIVVPPAAGLAVTILVGWLLVLSGVMHFVYAWYPRSAGAIVWEILVGIAYVVVGGYVLLHPLAGMAGLTLALAIYLFAEAVLEFILGFQLRSHRGSGWLFLDGVITLILAAMIWRTWPSSTDWALGILVGVSMLFSGISRLMFSMAARSLSPLGLNRVKVVEVPDAD